MTEIIEEVADLEQPFRWRSVLVFGRGHGLTKLRLRVPECLFRVAQRRKAPAPFGESMLDASYSQSASREEECAFDGKLGLFRRDLPTQFDQGPAI